MAEGTGRFVLNINMQLRGFAKHFTLLLHTDIYYHLCHVGSYISPQKINKIYI